MNSPVCIAGQGQNGATHLELVKQRCLRSYWHSHLLQDLPQVIYRYVWLHQNTVLLYLQQHVEKDFANAGSSFPALLHRGRPMQQMSKTHKDCYGFAARENQHSKWLNLCRLVPLGAQWKVSTIEGKHKLC